MKLGVIGKTFEKAGLRYRPGFSNPTFLVLFLRSIAYRNSLKTLLMQLSSSSSSLLQTHKIVAKISSGCWCECIMSFDSWRYVSMNKGYVLLIAHWFDHLCHFNFKVSNNNNYSYIYNMQLSLRVYVGTSYLLRQVCFNKWKDIYFSVNDL